MSEPNKTAGGRATESGMGFQAAVATWFAVQLLVEMPIGSQFGLRRGIKVVGLQCESGETVDDVVVRLEGGGAVYAQCKTRPGLTSGADSLLAKAIEQLVDLYLCVGHATLTTTPNAVLLAVAQDAPQSLEYLEDACRMFDYGGTWDTVLAQLPSKKQEALTLFETHIRTAWTRRTTETLTNDNLVSMARLFRISRFAEDATGVGWREGSRLLGRRLYGGDEAGEAPMAALLGLIRTCIRTGAPLDRDGLLRALRNEGHTDVSAPAYKSRILEPRMPDVHADLLCEAEDGLLLRSFGGSHQDVLSSIQRDLQEARELAIDDALKDEERAKLESWIEEGETFLRDVTDPEDFIAWSLHNSEGTPFRIRITNRGDAPANGIRVRVILPDWLLPSRGKSPDISYEGAERPSSMALVELMEAVETRKGTRKPPVIFNLGIDLAGIMSVKANPLLTHLASLNAMRDQLSSLKIPRTALSYRYPTLSRQSDVDIDDRVVEVHCKRLAHKHEWTSDEFWVFTLSGAKEGTYEVIVEVFAEEQLDWSEQKVTLQIG